MIIQSFDNKHSSMSSSDPLVSAEKEREERVFGQFKDKRVKIKYSYSADMCGGAGEKIGTIKKMSLEMTFKSGG